MFTTPKLASLIFVMLVSVAASNSFAQEIESIEQLIELHIEALGSKETVSNVKNFQRISKATGAAGAFPINGTMKEIVDVRKRRSFTLIDLGAYTKKSAVTGDAGWVDDSQQGKKAMPEEEIGFARLSNGISPLLAIKNQFPGVLSLGKEKEFDGKQCHTVSVLQSSTTLFVDRESRMVVGILIDAFAEFKYSKFIAIEGVQFPAKAETSISSAGLNIINEYTSTEINVDLDESIFSIDGKGVSEESPSTNVPTAKQMMEYLDQNGDQKISRSEANAELKAGFDGVDSNGDGLIDMNEARTLENYLRGQITSSNKRDIEKSKVVVTAKQIIATMDENSDGKIGKGEASEELLLFFDELDINGDGFIDQSEGQAMADHVNNNR